nr:hypothetical protein [Escherichia coli]
MNAFEAAPNLNIFTYLLALSEEHILFIMATAKSSSTYISIGTVAKLAMRQPFVLFKGLTFQKLCLPGAFR